MHNLLERYGPCAIVTGASSGIGAEFARQLASKGFDLVTVARRRDVLDQQAKALRNRYGVKVTVVAADLSRAQSIDTLLAEIKDMEIGMLIANAGAGQLGPFVDADIQNDLLDVIHLNAIAPTLLAHKISRAMVARGRGGIIFTGSTMAFNGVPFMATYAATKAFLLTLGEALHVELSRHGIDICVLSPGPTDTPMIKGFDMSKFPVKAMAVEPVVTTALNSLGKKPVAIPGSVNKLMSVMGKRMMSRKMMTSMFGSMMEQM